MKWEKDGNRLKSESKIHRAQIVRDHSRGAPLWILDLQIGVHPRRDFDSRLAAEKWAEARMNEIKKEFILSLITKFSDDLYTFGGLLEIVGGYDVADKWCVYQNSEHEQFHGTLEQCKNYIVSCF